MPGLEVSIFPPLASCLALTNWCCEGVPATPETSTTQPEKKSPVPQEAAPVLPGSLYAQQTHLRELGATDAWKKSQGEGITVAVFDNGFYDEPDLADAYVEDAFDLQGVAHRDTVLCNGHGSTVAATIAAAHDDAGVSGVAPRARILRIVQGYPAWVELERPSRKQRGALQKDFLEQTLRQGAEAVRWAVKKGAHHQHEFCAEGPA